MISKTLRLSEIARINPPIDNNIGGNDEVGFVPMAAFSEKTASVVREETREYASVRKGFTTFMSGDVLLAKITPCFENGKIGQAMLKHEVAFGSTEFHVIRPIPGKSDARFLHHFMRSHKVRIDGTRKMTGSAGQRRVPKSFLESLQVPNLPLDEQRRIAGILDRAEELRAQRRAAIALLDQLPQAIFLEMFGDPATNPMDWPIVSVGDLLASANYGTSGKAGLSGEWPILRMGNITNDGQLDLQNLKYIDFKTIEVPKYTVKKGDLLFNRTNSAELVGKTALFSNEKPMAFAGYLVRLRVNEKADPQYLAVFMNLGYTKKVLRGMAKSIVGMANINAKEVQTIKLPRPPIELQTQFAARVDAIHRAKAAHQSALTELDALFASLQSRAFSGELSAQSLESMK